MEIIKGYKVFNPDFTCRGFQFEVGKEYEMKESPIACERGFHFCTKASDCFNYYEFKSENKVAEVEAYGECAKHGDDTKVATNKIRILRELTWHEVLDLVNIGKDNTGINNTGDGNTGNWNTGNRNTGDWNTGNRNTGDGNTGDWNTGNRNIGNWNTGNRNTGDGNTGDWNTGNRNTGFANVCNFSTGALNTKESNVQLFNKETNMTPTDFYNSKYYYALSQGGFDLTEWIYSEDMTEVEKQSNPSHETTGGYLKKISYKEAWAKNWENKSEANKQIVKSIPNFDSDIFFEITGIDLR